MVTALVALTHRAHHRYTELRPLPRGAMAGRLRRGAALVLHCETAVIPAPQRGHHQDRNRNVRSPNESGEWARTETGSKENIDNAARRRLRGYAAQFLLITFTVATANLRRIQSFRDKQLAAKSAADYEVRIGRQTARREKRRSRDDRIAPWGDFSKAEPAVKDALPAKAKRPRTPKRVVPPPERPPTT
jgi:hypothetical protein